VIAIVNRATATSPTRADGVLYTSDGRDVEMSVASTKAFYAQIAAGFLLACAIAEEVPGATRAPSGAASCCRRCASCPTAMMEATLARRPAIAEAAQELARPSVLGDRRQRAPTGRRRGDPDQAQRALLQVDRLRRDRGQEAHRPVVGAADPGVRRRPVGSTADDVAKEVAIYRAHKATPIVIATEDEDRFSAALRVLTVPAVHPSWPSCCRRWSATCSATRRRWPSTPRPAAARGARAIEDALSGPDADDADRTAAASLRPASFEPHRGPVQRRPARAPTTAPRGGTAVRLASLFRYATGTVPLDAYQVEFGRVGTPAS
jgi:glucosamine--fructose-6-phosphate aminotransferase (isomerizing)